VKERQCPARRNGSWSNGGAKRREGKKDQEGWLQEGFKHFADEFMGHVGVELSPITVPYPVYAFEYVSAGGNSSQRSTVTLNTPTIDALVGTMSQKIKFNKSAAGQRALMTARLRTLIKARDQHTCRYCSVSLAAEPHLLLEVDHVIPVSKGGMTTEDNLQTLCWRCNRTKSNKILSV